jgi:MinD-like ATPase involved in chromosome partitioning or flagellar assembly
MSAPVIGVLRELADAATPARLSHGRIARLLLTATLSFFDPGTAEALETERSLIHTVRAPQHRHRVIAVVSGKGGTGSTTVVLGMALTLAALRDEPPAVADTHPGGTASLGARLGASDTSGLAEVAHGRPVATAQGIGVVDAGDWSQTAAGADVQTVLDMLTADHTFTLLDVGNDASAPARAALAAADQIVIVTTANQDCVHAARSALEHAATRRTDPSARPVIAIVCMTNRSWRRTSRRLRGELGTDTAGIIVVPHDRALMRTGPIDAASLRPSTREAYLALAALVVGEEA